MPAGTKVDEVYQALRREGHDEGSAARIAQWRTGEALATGKPPKGKKKKRAMTFKAALEDVVGV